MKTFINIIFAAAIFATAWVYFLPAERYQNAVYDLVINKDKTETYERLAKEVGFEINKTYTYLEFSDIKVANNLGAAGNYEFLPLSTGGTEADSASWAKYIKQTCGWQTMYYTNHDMTIIHEICNDQDKRNSSVRILKLSKGKRPELYKE